MQKQKTIAKWLAVVLLLTVAIACYVALSAVLPQKTKNSDIAGANDSRPDETTEKVYSSFPRQSQSVDGAKINNVGGSDNDSLVIRAANNLEKLNTIPVNELNTYDVVRNSVLVISADAVDYLQGVYGEMFDNNFANQEVEE